MEQGLGQRLYILMTYCHWNAIYLQGGEELSYLGFQTNWTWVLATSVEHSHGAWGGTWFESPVEAGSGAANLPQAQCLAVLAQFCGRAINLHVFPS